MLTLSRSQFRHHGDWGKVSGVRLRDLSVLGLLDELGQVELLAEVPD